MPRITKAQLDRHAELKARAAELGREARTLNAESTELEKVAKEDLVASGKDSIRRGGYTLRWIEGRPSIAWKSELLARLGSDVAKEIEAEAAGIKTQKLAIDAPSKAA